MWSGKYTGNERWSMVNESDFLIETAKEFALQAHEGQVDKQGRPYSIHIECVVERTRELLDAWGLSGDSAWSLSYAEAIGAAWCHDVKEDADYADHPIWESEDFSVISYYVQALTKTSDQSYDDYIEELIEAGPTLALFIKLADNQVNQSTLGNLDDETADRLREKYEPVEIQLKEEIMRRFPASSHPLEW